ncbi:MAG: hypothetical protein F4X64_16690 [Chloroflexi bacterium]|nr:hypothetical protein [Chloroflexota bacterium]
MISDNRGLLTFLVIPAYIPVIPAKAGIQRPPGKGNIRAAGDFPGSCLRSNGGAVQNVSLAGHSEIEYQKLRGNDIWYQFYWYNETTGAAASGAGLRLCARQVSVQSKALFGKTADTIHPFIVKWVSNDIEFGINFCPILGNLRWTAE